MSISPSRLGWWVFLRRLRSRGLFWSTAKRMMIHNYRSRRKHDQCTPELYHWRADTNRLRFHADGLDRIVAVARALHAHARGVEGGNTWFVRGSARARSLCRRSCNIAASLGRHGVFPADSAD